jgi:LPXTG-site transpeptidase (sortase) family protein
MVYREIASTVKAVIRRAFAPAGTILVAGALLAGAGALESLGSRFSFGAERTAFPAPLGKISAGDTVARIAVPRLRFEAAVREGVDENTLAYGPGHVPGTALPGDESSREQTVIAVARDVACSFATKLALGDRVELRTPFGLRTYRVVERRTLKADELKIAAGGPPALTFLAPYPSDSIGPAPLRLEVRAEPCSPERASSVTRSATRSTGRSATLAALAVSRAFREGR